MKAILACAIGALVVAFHLAAWAGDDKGFDASKLVGSWTYVEGARKGEIVPKDHLKGVVKFDAHKVIVPEEGDDVFVMAYKVDASKSPAAIDLTIEKAPFKEAVGGKAVGIVAIEGDTLKLCYIEGKDRPTAFSSTKENKNHYFVLKRAK